MMLGVTDTLGSNLAAMRIENERVQFATGVYLADSGDTFGAMSAFETLFDSNYGFSISNGVTVAGMLSDTYYQSALEQLDLGGGVSTEMAVELFDSSARVGDSDAVDVHHGKAVAYARMDDKQNMLSELYIIADLDPGYLEKIRN